MRNLYDVGYVTLNDFRFCLSRTNIFNFSPVTDHSFAVHKASTAVETESYPFAIHILVNIPGTTEIQGKTPFATHSTLSGGSARSADFQQERQVARKADCTQQLTAELTAGRKSVNQYLRAIQHVASR